MRKGDAPAEDLGTGKAALNKIRMRLSTVIVR